MTICWKHASQRKVKHHNISRLNLRFLYAWLKKSKYVSFIYSFIYLFIHSFTPAISIAPHQVIYYSEALPTTARIGPTVLEFHAQAHRQLQVKDLSNVPTWRLGLHDQVQKVPDPSIHMYTTPSSLFATHLRVTSHMIFRPSCVANCHAFLDPSVPLNVMCFIDSRFLNSHNCRSQLFGPQDDFVCNTILVVNSY